MLPRELGVGSLPDALGALLPDARRSGQLRGEAHITAAGEPKWASNSCTRSYTAYVRPDAYDFRIITEHEVGNLIVTPSYLGVSYSEAIVLLQVTLSAGRKPGRKRAFFARAAGALLPPEQCSRPVASLAYPLPGA